MADMPRLRDPMKKLLDQLQSDDMRRTKTDKIIATYLTNHLDDIQFETAKSIATVLDVSAMSVGRFIRRLGFHGIDELKASLRKSRHVSVSRFDDSGIRFRRDYSEGKLLARFLQRQLDDITNLYALVHSAEWTKAVDMVCQASEVYVAGFQNVRGIGHYFSAQLSYTRPGVTFMDGLNGTYAEALDGAQSGRLLILFDVRRYASKARLLAEQAKGRGLRVVLLTDEFCLWTDGLSDAAISVPGSQASIWDGAAVMTALMDLFVSSVIMKLGDRARLRVQSMNELQDAFGDFER